MTTERLKALRPGERLVYYRGDFDADIARSNPKTEVRWRGDSRKDAGALTYRALLLHVWKTALDLAKAGRIKLHREQTERYRQYKYVAVGL